jgi:hypothetical protein
VTVKKLLPVLALVAAAAAYWFLLLAPKRQEVADLGMKITQAEAQLQAFESTAATYEAARKSYKANYTRLTSLGKAVPSDDDLRSLIVQLDATAAERDVSFETLDASGESSAPSSADESAAGGAKTPPGTVAFGAAGMAAMPLQFSLTGKFQDLSAALGDLEEFVKVRGRRFDVRGRLLRVEGFSLAPGDDGFPTLRAQVRATAYLMPETVGVSGAGAEPAATDPAAAAASTPSSGDAPATPQAATVTGVAR